MRLEPVVCGDFAESLLVGKQTRLFLFGRLRLFVQPVYIFLKRCRFLFSDFLSPGEAPASARPACASIPECCRSGRACLSGTFDDECGMVFDEKQFPVDVLQLPRYLLEAFRISPLRMEFLLHLRLVFRLLRADAPLFIFVLLLTDSASRCFSPAMRC